MLGPYNWLSYFIFSLLLGIHLVYRPVGISRGLLSGRCPWFLSFNISIEMLFFSSHNLNFQQLFSIANCTFLYHPFLIYTCSIFYSLKMLVTFFLRWCFASCLVSIFSGLFCLPSLPRPFFQLSLSSFILEDFLKYLGNPYLFMLKTECTESWLFTTVVNKKGQVIPPGGALHGAGVAYICAGRNPHAILVPQSWICQ